jgi:hypothetical protein
VKHVFAASARRRLAFRLIRERGIWAVLAVDMTWKYGTRFAFRTQPATQQASWNSRSAAQPEKEFQEV